MPATVHPGLILTHRLNDKHTNETKNFRIISEILLKFADRDSQIIYLFDRIVSSPKHKRQSIFELASKNWRSYFRGNLHLIYILL